MKKLIFVFLLFSASVTAQDTSGNFTIKAPIQVWQQLLDALDKSDASHLLIMDLKKFIIEQINQQVKKPPVKDSTDKVPKQPKPKS